MSGDWIKMRTSLKDEEEVNGIHKLTGLSIPAVIGSLQILWSWADGRTVDGTVKFNDPEDIDKRVGFSGFFQAMEKVGWISEVDNGIHFTNFNAHMSESAKKRSSDTKRKREKRKQADKNKTSVGQFKETERTKTGQTADKNRTNNGQTADKNRTREEKRREEKSNKKDVSIRSKDTCPAELRKLVEAWNSVESIKPVDRVTGSLVTKFNQAIKNPQIREILYNPDRIVAEIRASKFLSADWKGFTINWLFKVTNEEIGVLKVADGRYRGTKGDNNASARIDSAEARKTLSLLE